MLLNLDLALGNCKIEKLLSSVFLKILKEQSDQGLHYVPFCQHLLDVLLYGKTTLFCNFKYENNYSSFLRVSKFFEFFTVYHPFNNYSNVLRKPVYAICEQQR